MGNLVCIFILLFAWSAVAPLVALAQVTTDITHTTGSGDLGTRVTTDGHTVSIIGGTRSGNGTGPNLFHSFEQFSVGNFDTAKFVNTTPLFETSNILSRVTGHNPSSIFGTIDTTSYQGANFFLMNPAGIVFGPTATLNVSGSVAFTTADYLRFAMADGSQTGIFDKHSTVNNLLTSAPVVAFGFLDQTPPRAISVQGGSLAVQPGQSISIIGGNHGFDLKTGNVISVPGGVTVTGGSLSAPGGRITLAGVALPGEIMAGTLEAAPNTSGQSFSASGEVHISGSSIDARGSGDGTIFIRGGRLIVDASTIYSDTGTVKLDGRSIQLTNSSEIATSTASPTNSGRIHLQASGDIHLASFSFIDTSSTSGSSGHAGDIIVHSSDGDVNLSGGTNVQSFTEVRSGGNTGNIIIEAPHGHVSLVEFSNISNKTEGTGTLGDIQIRAHNLRLETLSIISGGNSSTGTAKPGNIEITLGSRLSLSGGSFINTTTFGSLDSGDLVIQAPEILITGKDDSTGFRSGLYDNTLSSGDGGHLHLFTDNLQLTNGGILFSKSAIPISKIIPSGNGGDISIEGHHNPGTSVVIDGPESGIFSNAEGTGAAGDISVKASSVTLQNGGQISAGTTGTRSTATGGSVTINARDHVTMTNGASITASTTGPGDAGDIVIKAKDVSITGGAKITAESTGTGKAGTVTIQGFNGLANLFLLDGVGSNILTNTKQTGTGGNIVLHAKDVMLTNGGKVSADTSGTTKSATGGTIEIQGDRVRIESGALVTSSTTNGAATGGAITVTARESVSIKDGATISASSKGLGNAGNISIHAGHRFTNHNGFVTTNAQQSSGGDIDIRASDLVSLINGQISTSVLGGAGNGGNIFIDPNMVVLQNNSQIVANASAGHGGNITILTPLFLADQSSLVNASSQFGLNGTVTIQSPTSNLSGTVGQLTSTPSPVHLLVQNRCVALADGQPSTLIIGGHQTFSTTPGGWVNSPPLMALDIGEPLGRSSEERKIKHPAAPEKDILSLRHLTPPSFLVRSFQSDVHTGCRL